MTRRALYLTLIACAAVGCRMSGAALEPEAALEPPTHLASAGSAAEAPAEASPAADSSPEVQLVAAQEPLPPADDGRGAGAGASGGAADLLPSPQDPAVAGDKEPAPVEPELPEFAVPPGAVAMPFGPARPLQLDDVLTSLVETFPLTEAALWQRSVYAGKELEALGEWDTKLKGEHIAQPLGFYENYRTKLGAEQPHYAGGYSAFQYRAGRGDFEPWYKERQTDEGGEFEATFGVPLWRNRTIDEWRAKLWTARVDRQAVEPEIQSRLLDYSVQASWAYWTWVEAGQQYEIQKRLLELIRLRTLQIEERFRQQDVARIDLIDNDRGLARREEKLVASERKLQAAALKLSIFMRTPAGDPVIPPLEWLPPAFPELPKLDGTQAERDVQLALAQRPELRAIALDMQRERIEAAQGENLTLADVQGILVASQDVGARATPLGDKKPFELEAGLSVELPVQARKGTGRMRAARARMMALQSRREYSENQIAAEVRDAVSAMVAAAERAERARRARDRSAELVELERFAFEAGDSTLFTVNLREQDLVDSETIYYEALGDFFRAEADYRAAIGMSALPALPPAAP
ncbi:MAG TPA: TolC family protein [Pirellulaceae bacterium]|jgi:outer membrane protein TolC|nr:TolC family protein [Pirellulaceae bacterium]